MLTDERRLDGSGVMGVMLVWTGAVTLAALLLPTGVAGQGSGASDRQVLEALYRATNGPGWTDSTNWLTDAPLSEWFGVFTHGAGRVTQLRLDGNGLSGPIPAELGPLSRLTGLGLGGRWGLRAVVRERADRTDPVVVGRAVEPPVAGARKQRPDRVGVHDSLSGPARSSHALRPVVLQLDCIELCPEASSAAVAPLPTDGGDGDFVE